MSSASYHGDALSKPVFGRAFVPGYTFLTNSAERKHAETRGFRVSDLMRVGERVGWRVDANRLPGA